MKFFKKENIASVLFVALFACFATYIAQFPFFQKLQFSPLIIGLVMGIIFANTPLRTRLPENWHTGFHFCTRTLLRTAIIFYGFRITFQTIAEVGLAGILISIAMVVLTFLVGCAVGIRLLKLDRDTTILTSAGSAICGAAAVLAVEPVLKSAPHKTAMAVATVVLFGTISMFIYPFLYRIGIVPFSPAEMGLYIGGSVHEVAQVVAAGSGVSEETAHLAVIVKMVRVMLLAPFLIVLGIWLKNATGKAGKTEIVNTIPWFAVLFIVMAGVNSLNIVPSNIVNGINIADGFALTMAMSALGMETSFKKFKEIGPKPLYLAAILFAWLLIGGFFITKQLAALYLV